MSTPHNMHVENRSCDCGDNGCHGHTIHYLMCSCGLNQTTASYGDIPAMVLAHAPDFASYKKAMKDCEYPR